MLSNPTNLHQRQRQHRRQQSTPTAFEAPKVPLLPNIPTNGHHRRGMSLDQRRRRQPSPQDNKTVSITNNGFHQTQQHILREAQQQRLVRPGQQQQQAPRHNLVNDENYLISPLASPQSQCFESGCVSSYGKSPRHQSPYLSYSGQTHTPVNTESNGSSGNYHFSDDDPILFTDNEIPSAYLEFSAGVGEGSAQENWGTMRPSTKPSSSRRVSGGIADRVAIFEGMIGEQSCSRPITPPNQNVSSESENQMLWLVSTGTNTSRLFSPYAGNNPI